MHWIKRTNRYSNIEFLLLYAVIEIKYVTNTVIQSTFVWLVNTMVYEYVSQLVMWHVLYIKVPSKRTNIYYHGFVDIYCGNTKYLSVLCKYDGHKIQVVG